MFMIGLFFRESVIVVLFYSVLLNGEDILENYRPAPGLPEELNGWLASVQGHKEDFALIRRAAQKLGRYDMEINNERKREFKPKYLINLEDDEDEGYSEDRPENDIYPYMYRRRMMEPLAGIVETPFNTRKLRLRRDSAEANKIFHRNDIRLNLQAENGKILRSADKYPGRYKNDPEKGTNKRDLHIDVYSDGKLIKQTNTQDSKAIVLNIQPSEGSVGNNQMIQPSQAKRAMYCPKCSGPLARSSGKISSRNSKEEVNNNFRNLFLENEHLNTDTSIHYQNPIIYHVSLPDVNAYLKSATTEEINNLAVPNQNSIKNSYHQNNLEDMSPYWSQTEKNIMQKGLEVAQKIVNIPSKMTQASIDKNGFEKIESIVVDDIEGSNRANDKRHLKNLKHYSNIKDSDNQIQLENDMFDSKALQKKIFDSNEIIRSHRKYGNHFQNFESNDKKISVGSAEKDGTIEKDQNNPKTLEQENKGDEQINLDTTASEIQPLQEKEIDLNSNVDNIPLDVDNMIANPRNQMYINNNNQDNAIEFKNENNIFETQQKNDYNETPVENRHSSNSYEDYDHAKVEVRFDSPTHSNENDFVPNNFIRAGKKRPSSNPQFDHYSRRRRNFVLKNVRRQPERNEFLTFTNERSAKNIESQTENQFENLPSLDNKKQNLNDLVPFYLPIEQQDKLQSDTMSSLVEIEDNASTEKTMISTEENVITTNMEVIFSQLEQDKNVNIKPFLPKKPQNQKVLHKANEGPEINTVDDEINTVNDKINTENRDEHVEGFSYKPAVLIVINPHTPEKNEEEYEENEELDDILPPPDQLKINESTVDLPETEKHLQMDENKEVSTESPTTPRTVEIEESTPIAIGTMHPFDKFEKQEGNKYDESQHRHFPLKKIEEIHEHIETNKFVTKIETFTIENSSHNEISEIQEFTKSSFKTTVDFHGSISMGTLSDEAKDKLFRHPSVAHVKKFPMKRMQHNYLSTSAAEESSYLLEGNRFNRLRKRKHHRVRKKKGKKQYTKKNWYSRDVKDYVDEDRFIENPNRDYESIPAFIGRQLKSLNYTDDKNMRYHGLETMMNKRNGGNIGNIESEFSWYNQNTGSTPAVVGRKLQSQDYIYDIDLRYPNMEDVFTEKKKAGLHHFLKRKINDEQSSKSSVIPKYAAEGNYAEEEESDSNLKEEIKKINEENREDEENEDMNIRKAYSGSIPVVIEKNLKLQDYIYDIDLGYPDLDKAIDQNKKEKLYHFRKRENDKKTFSTTKNVLYKDGEQDDYEEEGESNIELGEIQSKRNEENKDKIEDESIDGRKRNTDFIPVFMGRKLKSQDYIYDIDLGYPDLDEAINRKRNHHHKRGNDMKVVSTVRSVLHKDAAEGDYGEEEESDNTTNNKNNKKPIKKTVNEFAHPVSLSTESDDYYYDEDYEQETGSKNTNTKNTKRIQDKTITVKKTTRIFIHPKPTEKPQKSKPPRRNQQKTKKRPVTSDEMSKLVWKRDEQKQNSISNPNLPRNSEFQQWPKFLRNDQENEELMRKRSLSTTSQSTNTNTFPLSTSSFFVTTQKDKRSTDSENVDKSLVNKAAFVGDEDKNAVTALNSVRQMETVNLPDVSLNLDSDAKLMNTLLPLSVSTEFSVEDLNNGITLFSNIEKNTTNPCTEPLREVISNACEDNQDFFNRTQIPISSVLPLLSDMENENGESYEPFEHLDPIITGEVPFKLIDEMLSQIKSNKQLKHFRKGLKKTFSKDSLDNILDSSNMESKKIITQMSNLLNKLQITTNCQALHPRLKHYLKLITKAKTDTVLRRAKELEGKPLDEHQNLNARKNFVFSSGELSDNLEDKAGVLKDLLNKYKNLPDQCKPRALPLKEYIERHLGMLNNILSENDTENNNKVAQEERDSSKGSEQNNDLDRPVKHRSLEKGLTKIGTPTVNEDKALINEQLEDLGLGENQKFKPNFDLNDLINQKRLKKDTYGRGKTYGYSKHPNNKRLGKRHSESYEKLLNAIAKEKMRKIRESRLGQMYGRFNDDLFNYNGKSRQNANGFESPLVYSF